MNARRKQQLDALERALGRLDEALRVIPTAPLAIDGTIQRFEFVYELSWKTARAVLLDQGVPCGTPRETFKHLHHLGWISDESLWLEIVEARNQCSHLYDEAMAGDIYARIPRFAEGFRHLSGTLLEKAT